ncbi:heme uptake protein IsdC [Paenibacillus algorifonticola]|uniref:heme uptake protein IsdC n=1 Tax=Paenibacillus algorifonticola TaxID=684063 RepID=UPI0022B0EE03|nr:heme uptake protein IsdC [Paenibacillus algorifonticola]
MSTFLIICFLVLLAAPAAYAENMADGTYTIDYVIKKAEDGSASMANDYWEKPAKVIVENGKITVQLQINHSAWVTEFKVPGGGGFVNTKVVSSSKANDTRVVQFSVDDLSKTMLSKIHVTVPDIDYDHDYTIRFDFDTNSLKLVSKAETPATTETTPKPAESAATKPIATPTPKVTASPKATKVPAKDENSGAAAATPKASAQATPTAVEEKGAAGSVAESATPSSTEPKETAASASPEAVETPEASADAATSADEATASPEEADKAVLEEGTDESVDAASATENEVTAEDAGKANVAEAVSVEAAAEVEPLQERSNNWTTPLTVVGIVILAGAAMYFYRKNKTKN